MAQVSSHEVCTPQVGPTQISLTEIGLTQIGVDLRMLSSPCIPRRDSLVENSEVLLICHRVSLLFACCSHYMALEGTLQGRIAWLQGVCLFQHCISRVRLSLYWPAAPRGDRYEAASPLPPPTVYHLARGLRHRCLCDTPPLSRVPAPGC